MKSLAFTFVAIFIFPIACIAQSSKVELSMEEAASYGSLDNATTFNARVFENRSYCCQVWTNGESNNQPSFDSISSSTGTLDFISDRGQISPYIGAGNAPIAARKCFVATPVDFSNAFITLGITSAVSPILSANIRCAQTTLFGGFNTVVTDFNFIEVTNTLIPKLLTDPNDGVVRFRITATGTISGTTVLDQTVNINPGQRIDLDVHSAAGNDFGSVVIAHNGPPGALRAVNAQYKIVTQSPLDFEPVLSVGFKEGL